MILWRHRFDQNSNKIIVRVYFYFGYWHTSSKTLKHSCWASNLMSCISNSNAAGMNSPMKFWHEFMFSLFSKLRSRLSQKASPCKILTTLATVVWPPYSVANNLMSYWHSLQSQDSSVQVIYYYFAIRKKWNSCYDLYFWCYLS